MDKMKFTLYGEESPSRIPSTPVYVYRVTLEYKESFKYIFFAYTESIARQIGLDLGAKVNEIFLNVATLMIQLEGIEKVFDEGDEARFFIGGDDPFYQEDYFNHSKKLEYKPLGKVIKGIGKKILNIGDEDYQKLKNSIAKKILMDFYAQARILSSDPNQSRGEMSMLYTYPYEFLFGVGSEVVQAEVERLRNMHLIELTKSPSNTVFAGKILYDGRELIENNSFDEFMKNKRQPENKLGIQINSPVFNGSNVNIGGEVGTQQITNNHDALVALNQMAEEIQKLENITNTQKEDILESIALLQTQAKKEKPNRSFVNEAFNVLNASSSLATVASVIAPHLPAIASFVHSLL